MKSESEKGINVLKASLEQFIAPVYGRTLRTAATYCTVAEHCSKNIERLLAEYHQVENNAQLLREIRNDIDYHLRRYHKYCIEERNGMGAHYHETNAADTTDFEHLIPASTVRDLMLAGVITVAQGLNAPTVRLCRAKHVALKDAGWASRTPDMWLPFRRYSQVFEVDIQTYDGTAIDPETWTLERHFEYFKHLAV